MKTFVTILLAVSGIGVAIWLLNKFNRPQSQPSQVTNTNSAGALQPFYDLWGRLRTPASTGAIRQDNTAALITAGGNALTQTVKSFQDLFKKTPVPPPVPTNVGSIYSGIDDTYDPYE